MIYEHIRERYTNCQSQHMSDTNLTLKGLKYANKGVLSSKLHTRPTLLSLENVNPKQILLRVKAILSHLKGHFSDKKFRSLVGRLLFPFTVLFSSSTLPFFKLKTSTYSSELNDVEFIQLIRI